MKFFSEIWTAISKTALPLTNEIRATSVFRSSHPISHATTEDQGELDGYWKARRTEKRPITCSQALVWVNRVFTQDIGILHSEWPRGVASPFIFGIK